MKKLLVFCFVFLCLVILSNARISAQSAYEQLSKDYCSNIQAESGTYGNDSFISLTKVNSPGTINSVKIDKVTVSGSTGSKTFDLGNTLQPASIAGGVRLLVPGLEAFVKQGNTSTSYSVNVEKTISYNDGDPNSAGGKITPKDYSCATQSANALRVQAQTPTQAQPQPGTQPGQGQPAPIVVTPVDPRNIYCVSSGGQQGIDTAIGCIPIGTGPEFVTFFLRWLMGISGGIAFLLIIWSAFQIMTAQGDPQKLQAGREVLTAAVSGLIFIIFSVFLLYLIGVKILNIPGL